MKKTVLFIFLFSFLFPMQSFSLPGVKAKKDTKQNGVQVNPYNKSKQKGKKNPWWSPKKTISPSTSKKVNKGTPIKAKKKGFSGNILPKAN